MCAIARTSPAGALSFTSSGLQAHFNVLHPAQLPKMSRAACAVIRSMAPLYTPDKAHVFESPYRVRAAMNAHSDFNAALGDLTAFFARLKANPPSGKQPAAAPEQRTKSGAAQQSSAAGTSARSGSRQPGSGAGTGGQTAKSRVSDTAGKQPDQRKWKLHSLVSRIPRQMVQPVVAFETQK